MTGILQALFLVFIEVNCCNIFFETFLERRINKRSWLNRLLLLILIIFLAVVATMFLERLVIRTVVIVASIAIVMYGMYHCQVKQLLFFTICFYGVVLLIDAGVIGILRLVSAEEFYRAFGNPTVGVILAALSKSILFLCVVGVRRRLSRIRPYNLPENQGWFLFLFSPIVTVLMLLLLFMGGIEDGRIILISTTGLLTANMVLFYMLQGYVLRSREYQELKLLEENARRQLELQRNREHYVEELRRREHEFRNQMSSIRGMLTEGNDIKALEYVKNICDTSESYSEIYDTSNAIINAIVNQKYWEAKKEEITILFHLDMLANISIAQNDLVIMLSNLLDNAIEACSKETNRNRIINFRMQIEEDSVIIATKNPVVSDREIEKNGKVISTKENPEQHGLGLQNIEMVVKKYNGDSEYESSEGFFYHTIIFKKECVVKG